MQELVAAIIVKLIRTYIRLELQNKLYEYNYRCRLGCVIDKIFCSGINPAESMHTVSLLAVIPPVSASSQERVVESSLRMHGVFPQE